MRKSSILHQYQQKLKNHRVILALEPNLVCFPARQQGQNLEVIVEVGDEITIGQILTKSKENTLTLQSTVAGKITTIEEKQNQDGSFSFYIIVENTFAKKQALKKLINPSEVAVQNRIAEALITPLEQLNNKQPIVIQTKDEKGTLGLNKVLFSTYFVSILKGAHLIQKAFPNLQVSLLVAKEKLEAVNKELQKLNLKNVTITTKSAKKAQVVSLQTALDLYEAVSNGEICTEHIVAVGGASIQKIGYYLFKIGTPLKELMALCGNLKHTYEEVEAYKEDAMMAVYDEIQIKKQIKESKTETEKAELRELLKQKKLEAKETIFDYFEENQKKYGLCLSNMVFLESNHFFEAKSPDNIIDHSTQAVLFLSNKEYKNKTQKHKVKRKSLIKN